MTIEERNNIFDEYKNLIYYTFHRNRNLMERMRMEADDFKQELSICLLKAIESYDPARWAKPLTYYITKLKYGIHDLWRTQLRLKRLANMYADSMTRSNDEGEESTLELPFEVDYDTDLRVKEFLKTLSERERKALARKINGNVPSDKRQQKFMEIVRQKALRFKIAGGTV